MSKNSIGLRDLDDVELVNDVERTFAVKFTNEEAEATLTVGQLYDLIETKGAPEKTRSCLSQHVFYWLREVLTAEGIKAPVTPKTSIAVIRTLQNQSVRKAWCCLSERSGLALPPLEYSDAYRWTFRIAVFSVIAAVCGALVAAKFVLWHIAVIVPFLFVLVALIVDRVLLLAFGDIPFRLQTVGDLAREVAGHNFSVLARARRGSSPQDRWAALLAVIRRASGYKSPIDRETTFMAGR